MPRRALLLIAHGSRRAEANADLDHLAAELRARGRYDAVRTSYLELAPPTIAEGGAACVAGGAGEVILLPYFLSPGVHVREDLQEALSELRAAHPGVAFTLAEHLGRHPLLTQLVEERARAAEGGQAHPGVV